jgi:hypothetical protein
MVLGTPGSRDLSGVRHALGDFPNIWQGLLGVEK